MVQILDGQAYGDFTGGGTPSPSWPPPEGFYLDPNISYTGTPDNVESIDFGGGFVMTATGTGDNITIDSEGLHFNNGRYFTMTVPGGTAYSGVTAFARITPTAPNDDSTTQRPISMTGSGISLIRYRMRLGLIVVDGGNNVCSSTVTPSPSQNSPFVMGVVYSEPGELPGLNYSAWFNGYTVGGTATEGNIAPDEWVLGEGLIGTMHEGIVFARLASNPDPMLPAGVTPQWISEQLTPTP